MSRSYIFRRVVNHRRTGIYISRRTIIHASIRIFIIENILRRYINYLYGTVIWNILKFY